jgi:hypothetical protein
VRPPWFIIGLTAKPSRRCRPVSSTLGLMKKLNRRRRQFLPWKQETLAKSADELLRVHWWRLPATALVSHLKSMLTRECQCRPRRLTRIEPPWFDRLQCRYRRQRLLIATKLSRLDVSLSARTLAWSLPSWRTWRTWPGSVYLIGGRTDADLDSSRSCRYSSSGSSKQRAINHQIFGHHSRRNRDCT